MRWRPILALGVVAAVLQGGAAEAAWAASRQPGALPSATSSASSAPAPTLISQPATDQGNLPTFTPPSSLTRGDELDAWCQGKTTALNIAVCGDGELRGLAIERLRAFEEARTRLASDRVKTLVADQNGWAMWYPQSCGLQASEPPSLPLDPAMRDCLAKAGRARLAYLRAYGTPAAERGATASELSAADAGPPSATAAPAPNATAPQRSTDEAVGAPPIRLPSARLPAAAQSPGEQAAANQPPTPSAPAAAGPPAASAALSKPASANPLIASDTRPWRSGAAAGAMLIAVGCVGLWALGVLRRVRSQRDKSEAPHA